MRAGFRVLLIAPKFNPHSFWSYEGVVEVLGAKYPTSPLGLITLAALLPPDWNVRLVNRNTETLSDADFAWADLVMTGGMLCQQFDTLDIIEKCRARDLMVAVGGPDVTSSPDLYARANFRVLGEAEDVMRDLVASVSRGERQGTFDAGKFQVDVTKSPVPRFDLLKFDQYLYIGVQFSRGCPFTCEFCDIIELYGRNPRTKTTPQMLRELQTLYDLGYRGVVDFVDDNLIGNKKAAKAFLPHLIAWQKERDFPFLLQTEASLNIADDPDLMNLLREANFFAFFAGLESPDPETLVHMSKKQNTKRPLAESIQRIRQHGLLVLPGFVLGFDSEKSGVADGIVQCVEDADLPVALFSLLYALPGTQLTRRLEKEGRLRAGLGFDHDRKQGDFSLAGLNFETKRPRAEILADFRAVLVRLYEPASFFSRLRRHVMPVQKVGLHWTIYVRQYMREFGRFSRFLREVTLRRPDMRGHVWRLFWECMWRNPAAVRDFVIACVMYMYIVPLNRIWIAEIDKQLKALEDAPDAAPAATPRELLPV